MDKVISGPLVATIWLVAGLLMIEAGRRIGRSRLARDPENGLVGLGAIEGAVFALFGLLIAFTFSGAAERFNSQRMLIVEEVNDIGTAYLRLDLLRADERTALRGLFRDYVDSRLAVYRMWADTAATKAELARSEALQGQIWTQAVAAARDPGAHPDAAKLLLPALNAMIDITSTRAMAARIHPPPVLYAFLLVVGLGCALLAGYGTAGGTYRSWLHIVGFIVIMATSLLVILDLEYPRRGLIRLDAADQVLVELRDKM